jgi:hypothetical protein
VRPPMAPALGDRVSDDGEDGTMNIPFQRFAPEIQPVLDIVNVAIFTLALAGLFLTFYTLNGRGKRTVTLPQELQRKIGLFLQDSSTEIILKSL